MNPNEWLDSTDFMGRWSPQEFKAAYNADPSQLDETHKPESPIIRPGDGDLFSVLTKQLPELSGGTVVGFEPQMEMSTQQMTMYGGNNVPLTFRSGRTDTLVRTVTTKIYSPDEWEAAVIAYREGLKNETVAPKPEEMPLLGFWPSVVDATPQEKLTARLKDAIDERDQALDRIRELEDEINFIRTKYEAFGDLLG